MRPTAKSVFSQVAQGSGLFQHWCVPDHSNGRFDAGRVFKADLVTGRPDSKTEQMRHASLQGKLEPNPNWESKLPFDMLVAYEDTPTRDRALHLCQHLSRELVEDYDFRCSWWKFEHLANPLLNTQSTTAAREASMIILSMRAQAEVSPLHRQWIESWAGHRSRGKAALVALLGTSQGLEGGACGTLEYLQKVARAARMDFFDHSFELPATTPNSVAANSSQTETIDFPPEHNLLHKMPIPRWGINE